MDVLPPLVACRVQRLKCLSTERDRVMERYLEERLELEMKYWIEETSLTDVWMTRSRGFIRSEGARRRRSGQRETTEATTTWGR